MTDFHSRLQVYDKAETFAALIKFSINLAEIWYAALKFIPALFPVISIEGRELLLSNFLDYL